jgi:hypothetical protein
VNRRRELCRSVFISGWIVDRLMVIGHRSG